MKQEPKTIHVLIVDNQPDAREWLAEKLRQTYGFAVETAGDGDECLELVRRAEGKIDVVLMDLRLNGRLDGIDVMKQVRSIYPATETIIITGFGDVEDGVRAMNEGAISYLVKPLQDEELVVYIRLAADRRNLLLQLQLSERERDWLAGLQAVGQAVTSTLDPDEVAKIVYEQTQRLLPHMQAFYIAVYEETTNEVKFILTVDDGVRVEHLPRELSDPENWGLTGYIIKKQQPIFSHDLLAEKDLYPNQNFTFNNPARAYIGLPLMSRDKLIGVISAQSYEPNVFNKDHERLLQAIANQVAVNLENALLHRQKSDRLLVLSKLYNTLTELRTSTNLEHILNVIVGNLQELFNLETCTVGLFDFERESLDFVAERGLNQKVSKSLKDLPPDLLARVRKHNELIELPDLNVRPDLRKMLVRPDITSLVLIPLMEGQDLLGIITMGSNKRIVLPTEQRDLFRALADQAAIAIQRARLHEQTQIWVRQLEALDSIAVDITKELDIEKLLQTLIERAAGLLHAAGGAIYLLTGMGDELSLGAYYGMGASVVDARVSARKGVVGRVVKTGQTYARMDYQEWDERIKEYDTYGLTAVVGAPIFTGDRLIGVLAVHDTKEGRRFSEAEQKLLMLFGRHAGAAIENAKVMEERRVVGEVTDAASVLDYKELLDEILDVLLHLKSMRGVIACALLLKDPTTNTLYIEAARNYPEEVQQETRIKIGSKKGITGIVAATGEPLIVPDVKKDRRYIKGIIDGRAEIAVPLKVRGEVIGVLDVESPEPNAFTERHQRILTQAATVIARAIENAKLFGLYKARKEALERLHQVGISIASALDYKTVLQSVVEHGRAMLNAECCSIFLVTRKGFISLEADSCCPSAASVELEIKDAKGSGLTGAIAARGQIYNEHGEKLLNDPAVRDRTTHDHLRSGVCTSLLAVPIIRRTGDREELVGLIKAQNKKDKNQEVNLALKFDETDQLILDTLASDTLTAIQNAQLYKLADMAQKVGKVVNSTLDLNRVLELVLSQLKTVLPFKTASIQLLAGTSLKVVAAEGFAPKAKRKVLQLSFPASDPEFPNYRVIEEKRPIVIPDIRQTPYQHFWNEVHKYCSGHIRSWLGVPLMLSEKVNGNLVEKVIGMVSIESDDVRRYTDMHKELGVAFASQVASAIANAKRYQSWQSVLSFMEDFSKLSDLPELLRRIAQDAVKDEAIGADIAIIHIYNPDEKVFSMPVVEGAPLNRPEMINRLLSPDSAVYSILNSKKPRIIEDVMKDRILNRGFARNEEIKSVAAFPLRAENQPVGVMFINYRNRHSFTPEEVELMERFANDAAVHIQRAHHFQTVEQRLEVTRNAALALSAMSAWAHDVTPITFVLRTEAKSLPKYIGDPKHTATVLDIVKRIQQHAEKIAALIPDAPEDFNQKKKVSLDAAFQQAMKRYEDKIAEKEIKVKATLKRLPQVFANEGCVVKVFSHLIQNALRAMSRGGKLTISGYKKGDNVYVSVSDTGPGIRSDVLENLFNTSNNSQSNGMGKGLQLTKLYLTACDGDILQPRTTPKGCTFTFYLPLAG